MSAVARRAGAWPLVALFAGAAAIATAPLFVRFSEAGPVSTAFWRVTLALPFLWGWVLSRPSREAVTAADRRLFLYAGFFFAGDLAVWHWSIVLTTVANSTLLANVAPIFVTLLAWWLYREKPTPLFLLGMVLALAGMILLIGPHFGVSGKALFGDALGIITAMFYAGYQLTVARSRTRISTATLMAWSTSVMAVFLLPLALLSGEQVLPASGYGWLIVVGLALCAQVAGQSLIASAMAHLPATFASVGLLLQPVVATGLASVLVGEGIGWLQIAGGSAVLAGIALARRAKVASA